MATITTVEGNLRSIWAKRLIPPLFLALTACVQASDPVPPDLAGFLTGEWVPTGQPGSIRFYRDGTVKIILPAHAPPVRLVSEYEMFKDNRIGIAMGRVWTGPATVDIANRKRAEIRLTLPEEQAITFHKR